MDILNLPGHFSQRRIDHILECQDEGHHDEEKIRGPRTQEEHGEGVPGLTKSDDEGIPGLSWNHRNDKDRDVQTEKVQGGDQTIGKINDGSTNHEDLHQTLPFPSRSLTDWNHFGFSSLGTRLQNFWKSQWKITSILVISWTIDQIHEISEIS